jgi:pimeloyl-ACP methyl ester carboxylesterase
MGPPKKIALVGHGFGSYISAAVVAKDPGVADAVVLTGFGYGLDALVAEPLNLRIAKSQNQANWGHLDGYLTWSNVFVNINK